MGATVAELQERIDAREFAEWLAYLDIEPWGPLRDELHARLICSVIGAANGMRSDLDTFGLTFWQPPQTAEDIKAVFARFKQG